MDHLARSLERKEWVSRDKGSGQRPVGGEVEGVGRSVKISV